MQLDIQSEWKGELLSIKFRSQQRSTTTNAMGRFTSQERWRRHLFRLGFGCRHHILSVVNRRFENGTRRREMGGRLVFNLLLLVSEKMKISISLNFWISVDLVLYQTRNLRLSSLQDILLLITC